MRFLAELRLGAQSPAVGQTPRTALHAFTKDVDVVGDPEKILAVDDRIMFNGGARGPLEDAMRALGATTAPTSLLARLHAGASASGDDLGDRRACSCSGFPG